MNTGFNVNTWELFDDPNHNNDKIFCNPYNRSNLANVIGDQIIIIIIIIIKSTKHVLDILPLFAGSNMRSN